MSADCGHVLVAAEFAGRRCRVKGRACSIARVTPSGALDAVPVAGEHRRGEGLPVGALIAVALGRHDRLTSLRLPRPREPEAPGGRRAGEGRCPRISLDALRAYFDRLPPQIVDPTT